MRLLRAWLALVWLSFRRLLWSSTTFMVMFPLLGVALFLLRYRSRLPAGPEFDASFSLFTGAFVIVLFTLFLLPVFSLAYATSSIGGDREERTLLFLLVRPIPRPLVLLGKLCATAPLVLGLVVGSFYLYCHLAGPVGRAAFSAYLPAVFYMTLAYLGVFQLFAVWFRHPTIVALIYGLFVEPLVGSMPGVINRFAISFYGRSMLDRMPRPVPLVHPSVFESVSASTAAGVLLATAAASIGLAAWMFQRKEYRDLS